MFSQYNSKDGNIYDNVWDAKAADIRFNQNEKIINQLQELNNVLNSQIINKANVNYKESTFYESQCIYLGIDYYMLKKFLELLQKGDLELVKKYDNIYMGYIDKKINNSIVDAKMQSFKLTFITLFFIINFILILMTSKNIIILFNLFYFLFYYFYINNLSKNYIDLQSIESQLKSINENILKSKESLLNKFNEFRYNNYNKEIEEIIQGLYPNLFDIENKNIIKQGTIDDYIKYIEKQ